ncbi:UvrB/UvrC motif-containing protein [Acetivibrio straminisolvens]|jgi:hypothetical protein|uniref:Uncharacterized protein n=1 Tax=Acetivibrio straminisolvens JCM 21531 TaxID=1294263 RepID=W4VC13_9FIRM|nr:UvrB/UvrC motif-containing protein [Acetivibrio straminisolvens]GAE90333.1 hypothetical protein JCM21531_3930 [Acetivibrio straminisolvens JCM 21531]
MDNISKLKNELEKAVRRNDIEKADKISDQLFRMQKGMEADTVMPAQFVEKIIERSNQKSGGQKSMKKIISIVAIAAVTATLGITALATRWYGVRDLVFKNSNNEAAITENSDIADSASDVEVSTGGYVQEKMDLIALQGYPDSNEYKASAEWNLFLAGYDTDGKFLSEVGNGSNEFTEKYPLYMVYTRDMAEKLEEIVAKYQLKLHNSITIVNNQKELIEEANIGEFAKNANTVLSGYVYDDGTFHYDGEALLRNGTHIDYQFGNYVKGTFSATYLNVGDASSYTEWEYKTSSGQKVSLALGDTKALVIADLQNSYVAINVLTGRNPESGGITAEDLQEFADTFDFSQIK